MCVYCSDSILLVEYTTMTLVLLTMTTWLQWD